MPYGQRGRLFSIVAMGLKPIAMENHRYTEHTFNKISFRTIKHSKAMGQTYHALWVHLIWGTKYRQPLIIPSLKYKLYDKMREIAKEKGYCLDFINGVEDHVHLLMGLKPSQSIPVIVKNLKGITHDWIRDEQLSETYFHWQDGYAAISVSPDRVPRVRGYIKKQAKHHKKASFEEEWALLKERAIVFPD